jgi:FkbH-like protein
MTDTRTADTSDLLLREALDCQDGVRLALLARKWQKAAASTPPAELKVAFLSEGSAETYLPQLQLMAAARGCPFQAMKGTFSGISMDILDPASKLYEYRPQICFIHLLPHGRRGARSLSNARSFSEEADALASEVLNLCEVLYSRLQCQIILTNFEPPMADPWSGLPPGKVSNVDFFREVNRLLAEKVPSHVHLVDMDSLVASFGRTNWQEPRLWFHAKQPMSHDAIVLLARKFSGVLAAIRGKSPKCLVLDLDNTLWGGVIGDDGLDGIRLGEGSAEGEAYKAFQVYLKGLKERGVLLAVCSKNEEATARKVFADHPEMVLRPEDICCFMANWEPKSDNCLRISRDLNISPDSLVFIDDNPAEREIVKSFLPQVRVLNLPEDVSGYPWAIEREFLFENRSVTEEDLQRTGFYISEGKRRELSQTITDLNSFLGQLAMEAEVRPYQTADVSRIAQLFNRSNQFNLCTRRYTESEVHAVLQDVNTFSFQIRLKDKFGDHGIVSLAHFTLQSSGKALLQNLVMSCRVLKRGVEELMCNCIQEEALKRQVEQVEFDYIPSPKNELVRNLYPNLGFEKLEDLPGGGARWAMRPAIHPKFKVSIKSI